METDEQRVLKKKLLHFGRPALVKRLKRCERSNVLNSSIYGSKNDLVSRIINSITSHKKNKEIKNKKKKIINRKPLKINTPIYNDINDDNDEKQRKLSPSSCNVTRKRKRKRKLKPPKLRSKPIRNPQKYIYKIINMNDRPFLNGKHCKIICNENNNKYRIKLLNNASEQIIYKKNLERIRKKHKRHKAIHIIKPNIENDININNNNNNNECVFDFSDATIKEWLSLIKSFPIDNSYSNYYEPLAIGVFVNFEMILKLFINNNIQYLFGTKYKTFKTQCLLFLDDYIENIYNKTYKIIDKTFILFLYKCNDKYIICLMRNENNDNINNIYDITGIKAINLSLMYACNRYKNIPTDFDILSEIFKLNDKYGFGEINKKEFNGFLSNLCNKTDIKSSSCSNLFDKIDKYKINAITFNQFIKYMIENKKILFELLLQLANEYELNINILLTLYQNALTKIHKLLLIINEIFEMYTCDNNKLIKFYKNNINEYIQFINTNQIIIDDKIIDYKKLNKNKNKSKNIKQIQKMSYFIHNNMPDIHITNIDYDFNLNT